LCGIAGFTHEQQPDAEARIRQAAQALHHRGPDEHGVRVSARVALGATRLRIIDLEHGSQPMEAGGTVIVFNGEIYNHAELRRELESLGHSFRSRCDTEVVLRAFLQWDTAAFPRLRGMFAAALWNEAERRLLLLRDRMGIKPLYFARCGRELYFASELKAILLHPEIGRALDLQSLSHYLSLNYVPAPYTLIAAVRKLLPGHWLEWRDGAVSGDAYWRLQIGPARRVTLNAAKEELDSLLHDAVREHLMADVPMGVWSSGGLDSSTVLHYAAFSAGARLKTFSVAFRGRSFDESRYFRRVSEAYGTEHHEFDCNPEADLTGAIRDLAWYSDEPSADAGALPVWFLSQMSRRHVTVALSGEGADELFGGYNTYIADNYARSLRLFLPRWKRRMLASLAARWPSSDEKISFGYKLRRLMQGSLLPPDEAHLFWNGTFSEDEKRAFFAASAEPVSALFRDLPVARGAAFLDRYFACDQLNYLPDDILYKCDRMSMAHSLEVRPAFLDHRIVEFAASLPFHFKVRGGTLKYLLRELMRDKLPHIVITRRKEGFDIPAHHWMRTVLRPLLEESVTREAVEATGVLRWEPLEQVIQAHLARRADYGYHLWGLMTLCLWMKRWNVQPAATGPLPKALVTA
jgi:asparagine synthase (glutamine-hydrolysing)